MASGILNINKPSGMSSANVVARVKRVLGLKKVGHMGTLDPLASGVLLVGVGQATKLFDLFLGHHKCYVAEFEFGYLTDTLDSEGEVVAKTTNLPSENDIKINLKAMCGMSRQLPPQFSAKSIGGIRAYKLARQGITVELEEKTINIIDMQYIERTDINKHKIKIKCSSGTYIRAIGRDLASRLNTLATMTSLVRVESGEYNILNSIVLDTVSTHDIIPINQVLHNIKRLDIMDCCYDKLLNGVRLTVECVVKDCDNLSSELNQQFLVYCRQELFSIAKLQDNNIIPLVNLHDR